MAWAEAFLDVMQSWMCEARETESIKETDTEGNSRHISDKYMAEPWEKPEKIALGSDAKWNSRHGSKAINGCWQMSEKKKKQHITRRGSALVRPISEASV